ncbi:MAG: cyclic nucleotide-binding domain-containing protein [Tatlockia sp.]|nr:cyclic nucleotide-binding domain-containing protein [Tatlockia sp.]
MGITLAFLISQIILLISYLMTSMLSLRLLVCIAQVGYMVATLMFGLDQPGMLPSFIFAVLIFLVNIVHIYRLIYAKLPAHIPDEYQAAYEKAFQTFSPREFLTLMKFTEKSLVTDDYIIKENTIADVSLILEGQVRILVGTNRITDLGELSIIGEISYLTNKNSIASVKAIKTVNFHTWSRVNLKKLKRKYPKVYYKFYEHLIESVSTKLRKQNIKSYI